MIAKDAVDRFLNRNLDHFTWMKKLSLDQMWDELKHYKVRPQFKGKDPWLHQLVSFHLGMVHPEFLFFLDMGTGKSRIVLDIFNQRLRERDLSRAFVTVPRLINLDSWRRNSEEYSDLGINLAMGSIEEKWETIIKPKGLITVIDYPGLQLALSKKVSQGGKNVLIRDDAKIKQLLKLYNGLNIDESHQVIRRMKKKGDSKSESLRYSIMKAVSRGMDFRYATTGTPFGNNPEYLWSQFYLVDHGQSLGDTLGMFRAAYFEEVQDYWKGTVYKFDKKKARPLYRAVQHRSIQYGEEECNSIPKRVDVPVPVRFADDQREHYLRAIEGLINANGNVQETDNSFHKLRQIVAGYLHWKDERGEHYVDFKSNPKLEALEQLLEESGDKKIVISYEVYTHTGKIICDRFRSLGYDFEWLHGGTKDKVACVNRFIDDPNVKGFIMNSQAGGTGTDGLQYVSNYFVFYDSPGDPITRKQALKRLSRSGQTKRTFIYDLIMEGSLDVKMLKSIEEGSNLIDMILNGRNRDVIRQLLL